MYTILSLGQLRVHRQTAPGPFDLVRGQREQMRARVHAHGAEQARRGRVRQPVQDGRGRGDREQRVVDRTGERRRNDAAQAYGGETRVLGHARRRAAVGRRVSQAMVLQTYGWPPVFVQQPRGHRENDRQSGVQTRVHGVGGEAQRPQLPSDRVA